MREADGIILGSPVYFGSATPQLISLLDRAAYVQRNREELFSGKIGGPIVVARRAGHNFTLAQLLLWYFVDDVDKEYERIRAFGFEFNAPPMVARENGPKITYFKGPDNVIIEIFQKGN